MLNDPKTALEFIKTMVDLAKMENDKQEKECKREQEEKIKSESEARQKFLKYVKSASHTSLLSRYSQPYEDPYGQMLWLAAIESEEEMERNKQESKMRYNEKKRVMEEEIIKRGFFDKRLADMSYSELFDGYSGQPIRYDIQYTLMGKSEKEIDDIREQNGHINELRKKIFEQDLKERGLL